MAIPFELVILFVGIIMIGIGATIEKLRMFTPLGGILLGVLSVVILANGIAGLDNLSTLAVASIAFGVGIISLLSEGFTKDKEEEPPEFEEAEDDGRYKM